MEVSPRFKEIYKIYMSLVGCAGHLMFFLQAYKIYETGCARDLSLGGFAISLFSILSWLMYGVIMKDKVLVLVNTIGTIGATTVVALIVTAKDFIW